MRILNLFSLVLGLGVCSLSCAQPEVNQDYAQVEPHYRMSFPRDFGSHPDFRTEWWYVTGWLSTSRHEALGFQITFFRIRSPQQRDNPSRFAAHQILIAHVALSDPKTGHLLLDQRARRSDSALAAARTDTTAVWLDDWRLERRDSAYVANLVADQFSLHLTFTATQPPMLNGSAGYSQKGAMPQSASYYYSEPHLRVSGTIDREQRSEVVSGEAWLDHEWSSEYLEPQAIGWDWVGINLADGGALMAFQIRDATGGKRWAGASLRDPNGTLQTFGPEAVTFVTQRRWKSARTGIAYPVALDVTVGTRQFTLEPLMDDQENDARITTGAVYWEGAVSAQERQQLVGRGYLELTGYDNSLGLRP